MSFLNGVGRTAGQKSQAKNNLETEIFLKSYFAENLENLVVEKT